MAARPCLRPLNRERLLPSGVRGPVLFLALRRLASMRFCEVGGASVFSGDMEVFLKFGREKLGILTTDSTEPHGRNSNSESGHLCQWRVGVGYTTDTSSPV